MAVFIIIIYIVTANTPGNQVKSWALRRAPGHHCQKNHQRPSWKPHRRGDSPHLPRHNWPL